MALFHPRCLHTYRSCDPGHADLVHDNSCTRPNPECRGPIQGGIMNMTEVDPCHPSLKERKAWEADGGWEATDGCLCGADGGCEHGNPSWLIAPPLIEIDETAPAGTAGAAHGVAALCPPPRAARSLPPGLVTSSLSAKTRRSTLMTGRVRYARHIEATRQLSSQAVPGACPVGRAAAVRAAAAVPVPAAPVPAWRRVRGWRLRPARGASPRCGCRSGHR